MEFSAKAKLNWELENNIVATLNPDPSKAIPFTFMDDPFYFQRVNISELSLLKMVTHSSSNPLLDLVGLLVGHPDGDSVIVTDAFALPVEPHEKVHSKLLDYYNTHLHDGVLDNVVGWYHSSKSGVTGCPDDSSTQIQIQHLKPLSVALIIEPATTINVVEVNIEAIMSFPEGFPQPPVLPLSTGVTAPKRQLPDHILAGGRHLKKRRRLVVKYFKRQVDANQVEDLWNKYWEYTLSSPISGIPRLVWNTARASEFKHLKNQVNTEVYDIYAENPGSPIKHSIGVNSCIAFERQPYGEDMEALFTQLLEEAGCSGSQISSTAITRVIATLTQDEAMKLSRNDWVNNAFLVLVGVFGSCRAAALDSIAVCLSHDNDNRKVEQALLKKEAVQKLVMFFQNCPEQHFVNILEPFLKIITKSPRINTTLAVNGLTSLLITKLDHRDAIARLNLLKLIKAVYEHHPRPKQLIVENDLPQKLQNLIEERRDGQRSGGGGQVLVKQMATSLLKALHINTVL